MSPDSSFLTYFTDASFVVKLVMLLLLVASIISWSIILQRYSFLKRTRTAINQFEELFWSGINLNKLYTQINGRDNEPEGLENIFIGGLREFTRLRNQNVAPSIVMEGAQRGMRIAHARELDKLEQHLAFLATVGSTSPYVGLFGTVWGIMTSFRALSGMQQATIATVAPGISEALVATAMGLFAAIPAVIAYNRFVNEVEHLLNHYDTFQEEFSAILYRQAHAGTVAHEEA